MHMYGCVHTYACVHLYAGHAFTEQLAAPRNIDKSSESQKHVCMHAYACIYLYKCIVFVFLVLRTNEPVTNKRPHKTLHIHSYTHGY